MLAVHIWKQDKTEAIAAKGQVKAHSFGARITRVSTVTTAQDLHHGNTHAHTHTHTEALTCHCQGQGFHTSSSEGTPAFGNNYQRSFRSSMFRSVPPEAIRIASKAKQGEFAACKKNAAGQYICELSNSCTILQGMFTVNKEHAFQIGVRFQGYRVEYIPFENLLIQHWAADLAVTSSAKVKFGQSFSHHIFVILF